MGDLTALLEGEALSGKSFEASRYMIFMALAEILRRLERLEAERELKGEAVNG